MVHLLKKMKHSVKQQHPITVCFDGIVVGEYFTDLLVDENVIVELKAADVISKEHEAQLLNYLRATQIEVGLPLNFGKQPEFKRRAFSEPKAHQPPAENSNKRSAFIK